MIPKINLSTNNIAQKFSKMGDIGEGTSIACDFLGKAAIVPAVIMLSSSEPKDKKEFSATKNPVAALIQLALEVPILIGGSKIVENLADKGFFDKKGSDFSYNQKADKKAFIDVFEKSSIKDSNFIKNVREKGYSREIAEKFEDIISSNPNEELKSSFKKFEKTYKNQFHLKNRICFVAALLLTPVLCALENKIHPKVMDMLYSEREKKHPHHNLSKINIHNFTKHAKSKGGI